MSVPSITKKSETVCEFPVGKPNRVTVTLDDYKRLKYGEYLNDVLINFGLLSQYENLPVEIQHPVYVYPTTFYERLCDTSRTLNLAIKEGNWV